MSNIIDKLGFSFGKSEYTGKYSISLKKVLHDFEIVSIENADNYSFYRSTLSLTSEKYNLTFGKEDKYDQVINFKSDVLKYIENIQITTRNKNILRSHIEKGESNDVIYCISKYLGKTIFVFTDETAETFTEKYANVIDAEENIKFNISVYMPNPEPIKAIDCLLYYKTYNDIYSPIVFLNDSQENFINYITTFYMNLYNVSMFTDFNIGKKV